MKKHVFFSSKSVCVLLCVIAPILVLSCTGAKLCKNNSISVDTIQIVRIDTMWRTHIVQNNTRDSIYLHDSVYVTSRGDTTYVERWHTLYKYIYEDTKSADTISSKRTDLQERKHDATTQVVQKTERIPYKTIAVWVIFILLAIGLWRIST